MLLFSRAFQGKHSATSGFARSIATVLWERYSQNNSNKDIPWQAHRGRNHSQYIGHCAAVFAKGLFISVFICVYLWLFFPHIPRPKRPGQQFREPDLLPQLPLGIGNEHQQVKPKFSHYLPASTARSATIAGDYCQG